MEGDAVTGERTSIEEARAIAAWANGPGGWATDTDRLLHGVLNALLAIHETASKGLGEIA